MNSLSIRRQAQILSWLVAFVLAVLCFGVAVEIAGVARGRLGALHHLIVRVPVLLYLLAVFSVWRAIRSLARGEKRELLAARLLTQVGLWLFLGGIAAVFMVPLALMLAFGSRTFAFYDVPSITLGVVGAALMVVANLLREAARVREELEEII